MSLLDELKSACADVRAQEPMARHTSLAVGGPADYYAEVNTRAELSALRRLVRERSLPVFFVGAGSNLLVSDRGIRGLVLHLQGEFRQVSFDGVRVTAGSAVWLPALAKQCAEKGLSGIEPMIGVPGSVGGGLVMNAGTREGWLGDVVEAVECLDDFDQPVWRKRGAIEFGYRHSNLSGCWVTAARLVLKSDAPDSIRSRMDALLQYRSRTQPLATSNCGSVFKNPAEAPAARLIEACGLKGVSVGGARISERHANFIINEKNATAHDVLTLMLRARHEVHEKFHLLLEPEVKLVGEFPGWGAR